ncbi:unnamed protein product [Nippostrongylus brasiliensis]|uniref:50S ribosomal protein L15 n=1 Tax=Nippostrongylus brasiliensis TaxID=27835 RepID=A0A0N4XJ54_NIPBR|nr:unnamed protein product [Nippostrongylus brasiliensis]
MEHRRQENLKKKANRAGGAKPAGGKTGGKAGGKRRK